MKFYDQQHEFYCGVDLHTRKMYLGLLPETRSGWLAIFAVLGCGK